jgi:hypothetical protein
MLTAVFRGHEGFVVFAVILAAVIGGAAYRVARSRASRPAIWGLWAACTTALLSLTLWTTGGEGLPQCVINKDVLEPFRQLQGQLNAAMFVPFGLLSVLATRRVALTASLSVLLSAVIETVQGLALGRLCDTSDLVANTLGAACGVVIGVLIDKRLAPPARRVGPGTRYAFVACGVTAAILSACWLAWMEPVVWERTVSQTSADSEQEEAVTGALNDAFGGRYTVESVEFTAGQKGAGSVMANFAQGAAELSWPDRDQFTVNLIPEHVEKGHTFAVPGVSGPAATREDAERIAVAYARRYAPWGLKDSKIEIRRVDEEAPLGWLVSWRRWEGEVLLPMRLDVVINPAGRISDLIARNIDDPALPPVKISEKHAWDRFEQHFGAKARGGERGESVLLAERRGGEWRVHWLLSAEAGGAILSSTIDATDGTIHNSQK